MTFFWKDDDTGHIDDRSKRLLFYYFYYLLTKEGIRFVRQELYCKNSEEKKQSYCTLLASQCACRGSFFFEPCRAKF